jgi:hypothetical protein
MLFYEQSPTDHYDSDTNVNTKMCGLTKEQQVVLENFTSKKSGFLTGSAGTGKSFLLSKIIEKLTEQKLNVAVLSHYGLAARNIKGTTYSSFFNLKPEHSLSNFNLWSTKHPVKHLLKIDVVVIDEVSTLSSEQLEIGSKLFNLAFSSEKLPMNSTDVFGGRPVYFCGDFLQLPPIGNCRYAFESEVWLALSPPVYYLRTNLRVNNKFSSREIWMSSLELLREGSVSEDLNQLISEHSVPDEYLYSGSFEDSCTVLFPFKKRVDEYNSFRLENLSGYTYFFYSVDTKYVSWYDTAGLNELLPFELCLKVGCKVITTVNSNTKNGYYNGMLGIVREVNEELGYISIEDSEGVLYRVCRVKVSKYSNKLTMLATREQYPVQLAWALSIHKSLGLSIPNLLVDFSGLSTTKCRFGINLVYVALSRASNKFRIIGYNPGMVYTDKNALNQEKVFKGLDLLKNVCPDEKNTKTSNSEERKEPGETVKGSSDSSLEHIISLLKEQMVVMNTFMGLVACTQFCNANTTPNLAPLIENLTNFKNFNTFSEVLKKHTESKRETTDAGHVDTSEEVEKVKPPQTLETPATSEPVPNSEENFPKFLKPSELHSAPGWSTDPFFVLTNIDSFSKSDDPDILDLDTAVKNWCEFWSVSRTQKSRGKCAPYKEYSCKFGGRSIRAEKFCEESYCKVENSRKRAFNCGNYKHLRCDLKIRVILYDRCGYVFLPENHHVEKYQKHEHFTTMASKNVNSTLAPKLENLTTLNYGATATEMKVKLGILKNSILNKDERSEFQKGLSELEIKKLNEVLRSKFQTTSSTVLSHQALHEICQNFSFENMKNQIVETESNDAVFCFSEQNADSFCYSFTTVNCLKICSQCPVKVLHCDMTFNETNRNLCFGNIGVTDSNQSFHPTMISIVPKEDANSYKLIFKTLKTALLKTLNFEAQFEGVLGDGSASITKSVSDCFPLSKRLSCYAHFSRLVKEKLKSKNTSSSEFLYDLDILRCAWKMETFLNLRQSFIEKWQSERDCLQWLSQDYLNDKHVRSHWHRASGIEWCPSTTNALERYNRSQKDSICSRRRLPLQVWLHRVLFTHFEQDSSSHYLRFMKTIHEGPKVTSKLKKKTLWAVTNCSLKELENISVNTFPHTFESAWVVSTNELENDEWESITSLLEAKPTGFER